MSIAQLRRAGFLACILTAGLLAADSPFVGTWKLNVEKSKLATSGIGQSSVVVEETPNGLKSTVTATNAKGEPINFSYAATLDGKAATVTGTTMFDSVTLTPVDAQHIKAVGTKDGKVVYTDQRQVSKDGKTMTIERDGTNADGSSYHATLVFERQ
ncbi:MAG TPA: hypothetical protein DEQ47_17555 [Solibacterales bacterium]|jgi:hypothetical protein|nr:hypothetical protein [Bryobacterales bacterium]